MRCAGISQSERSSIARIEIEQLRITCRIGHLVDDDVAAFGVGIETLDGFAIINADLNGSSRQIDSSRAAINGSRVITAQSGQIPAGRYHFVGLVDARLQVGEAGRACLSVLGQRRQVERRQSVVAADIVEAAYITDGGFVDEQVTRCSQFGVGEDTLHGFTGGQLDIGGEAP